MMVDNKLQIERYKWKCYLFGNKPEIDDGFAYIPTKNAVPNRFVRWMMKICFACTWVKEEDKC